MNKKAFHIVLCLTILTSMLLASVGNTQVAWAAQPPESHTSPTAPDATPQAPTRVGGWVDSITFTEENNAAEAIEALQANQLDVYAYSVSDPTLYQTVKADQNLAYTESLGSYYELSFNPAGPNFTDGRLNPFNNANIREAVNLLIDRSYIVEEIFSGLGLPKLFPIETGFPDYVRYADTCAALEAAYAYNLAAAQAAIQTEMLGMGATLVGGKWHYNGQPITIIFLIRTEDVRLQIGDYVANQLEAAGFTVDRQYKTRTEASPIWVQSNPADGLWHIYTGGWITTAIYRDGGANFSFFYGPYDYPIPLHQAYEPSPAFDAVMLALRDQDFSTMAERDDLFEQALEMALSDSGSGSVRVWLLDATSFSARRDTITVPSDLAGGISGSQVWPYVIRFNASEGGDVRMAQPGVLVEPWNPIGGSNWIYDMMPIRATADQGLLRDPNTGLYWPQRIENADVVAQTGLPVTSTLDWVDLSFAPVINVPTDAWVDWDAANQVFITAAEKFPDGTTAMVKSTVYYPADLFTTVKWHDGSSLSVADFIYYMIMKFDPGKPESPIYDESQQGSVEQFLSYFKGVRILSTNPLVIETYLDRWYLDAEYNVTTWFPYYGYGPGAWHNTTVGYLADAAGELAFSADKADALGIGWMSFISGPSLDILADHLATATAANYIPFAPTLGAYITAGEATARWTNLNLWYVARDHFWLGTGPFYLGEVDYTTPSVTLEHFADFPDQAGKWDLFAIDAPSMEINFFSGGPGSYLNVTGSGFPPGQTVTIAVNGVVVGTVITSTDGTFIFTLDTQNATPGLYVVTVSVTGGKSTEITESERFVIDAATPVRPLEGANPIVVVPENIAYQAIWLPVLLK